MKKFCLYHASDNDGRASAAIVNHFLGVDEFRGYTYRGLPKLDDIEQGDYLFIVDCSVVDEHEHPRFDILHDMVDEGVHVIWIDHHQDILDQYDEWLKDNYLERHMDLTPLKGLRTSKHAACELTWMFMAGWLEKGYDKTTRQVPPVIDYLGKYDSWQHNMDDDILNFHYGMEQHTWWPNNREWSAMLTYEWPAEAERILQDGAIIRKHHLNTCDRVLYSSGEVVDWEGLRLIAVNAHMYSSLDFLQKRDKLMSSGVEVVGSVAYYRVSGGKWKYSIRSFGDADVDAIARKYGGNGHKKAAGWCCDDMITAMYDNVVSV